MTGLLPADQTLVKYVSPDGVTIHLSGRPIAGAEGVWIGSGPDGLGSVPIKPIFEAAARQMGESYAGETVEHAEIDLPIHVLGEDADDFRRKRRWVENTITRKRIGWLCAYTPTDGWLWLAVRKLDLTPAYKQDPGPMRGATFNLLLVAEQPFAREADYTDEWFNRSGSNRGELHLYPGPSEWEAWPQFVLRGPGRFRLRWAGNDLTFPTLRADEWALVNTDQTRTTIRAVNTQGVSRNLWPEMPPGSRAEFPAPPGRILRVDISVTGGNTSTTSAWGSIEVKREGLV